MRRFLFFFLIIFLTSSCSETKAPENYEGHGSVWDAYVENSVFEKNGGRFFNIVYSYKGPNNELRNMHHISFALGTRLDNQIVNVFDNSQKEKLIAEGKYNGEEANYWGLIYTDIKQKNDNEFRITYRFNPSDKNYDTFDTIEKEFMNIQIHWENRQGKYKDTIDIKTNPMNK